MAPTGNAYAEKWTFERTIITLHTIDRLSQDRDCLYLGHALDAAGLYDDVWRYWRRKWRQRYEILDLMKRIMQRFEVRIFEKMARKEMPERVGMFALRHHYGWGKEPADTGTLPDDSYIDQELIHEPQPEPETTATEPATTQPQTPQTDTSIHPEPTLDEDTMYIMRWKYNQANPQSQIITPLPYFIGEPPLGFETIRFERGYFLKR